MAQDWVHEELDHHPARLDPTLEALPMNDGWPRFIIFTLGDPHLHIREQSTHSIPAFHKLIHFTCKNK